MFRPIFRHLLELSPERDHPYPNFRECDQRALSRRSSFLKPLFQPISALHTSYGPRLETLEPEQVACVTRQLWSGFRRFRCSLVWILSYVILAPSSQTQLALRQNLNALDWRLLAFFVCFLLGRIEVFNSIKISRPLEFVFRHFARYLLALCPEQDHPYPDFKGRDQRTLSKRSSLLKFYCLLA